MAMPPPTAATSGIHECPGSKPCGAAPWSARTSTIATASGRPASTPSTDATSDRISASAAISRRTWRGVAPRARSTAVSRRRCAIASANVPATTNSATVPAIPPMTPKIATSASRSAARGSPASASAAWPRVEDVHARAEPVAQPRLRAAAADVPGLRDDADRIDATGRAGQRVGDGGAKNSGGLAAVAARRGRPPGRVTR